MRELRILLFILVLFHYTKGQTALSSVCDLPKDEGTGSYVIVYLYYDKANDSCQPFRFKGEGGNGNRFIAEKYCMRNCSSRAESLYPTDPNKACRLPKAQGECLGTYIRYYYDPAQRQCKSFFWTGCEGNGNRFLDKQRCNDTCFEIKDEIEESPIESDEEIDTPVGIILGVVLGIVGVIILIVVIVLAVKNKPSPKKPQAKAKKDSSSPGPESPLQNDKIEMA